DRPRRSGVARSEAQRGRQAFELLDVGRIGREPGEASTYHRTALADPAELALQIAQTRAAGLRHEHRQLARLENVAVDRDVDAVDPVEHRLEVVENAGRRDVF